MADPAAGGDHRNLSTLMHQFDKLQRAKSALIKAGLLDGSATPAQVEETLRRLLPPAQFAKGVG